MTKAAITDDPGVVDAVHAQRLHTWAAATAPDQAVPSTRRDVAEAALTACAEIAAVVGAERDRLVESLEAVGVTVVDSSASDQRHTVTIDVRPADAAAALARLVDDGYGRHPTWRGGAERSFLRYGDATTLTRAGATTSVVRLRWARPATRPRWRRRIGTVIRPTPADWAWIGVPTPLWWVYPILRPMRLAGERLGVLSRDHGDLEPFLSTPDALIAPLLEVTGAGADDVVADLGCGDGRIVIAAARHLGCRAVGVEQSADTVALARRAVTAADVGDLVTIVHGGLDELPADVTAMIVFLPTVVAARLVPRLLTLLPVGARLVLHEQSPLPAALPAPERSVAIISRTALTVAHRWTVRG